MKGAHSIEILFRGIIENLPDSHNVQQYICTHKWKRFHSFFQARKHQGDVNHITGDIHSIALFLNKKKTILTIHDTGRYDRDLKGFKKRIFKFLWLTLPVRQVRFITTISEFTKQRLIEECKINSDIIKVIPNPAATDFNFNNKHYDSKNPKILQIGSGNNKNIHRLISAITGTHFSLILVRKPDKELEDLLKKAKIPYEWHYNISRNAIYDCYVQSDILFFASEYEGFGVPILEANAIGRPVITSNLSSMPYVAGNSAILVDPYHVGDIRRALFDINNDQSLREELVQKGLKNLERFEMKKIIGEYIDLYKKVVQ